MRMVSLKRFAIGYYKNQQQAIVRKRDEAEKRRREEAERQKVKCEISPRNGDYEASTSPKTENIY